VTGGDETDAEDSSMDVNGEYMNSGQERGVPSGPVRPGRGKSKGNPQNKGKARANDERPQGTAGTSNADGADFACGASGGAPRDSTEGERSTGDAGSGGSGGGPGNLAGGETSTVEADSGGSGRRGNEEAGGSGEEGGTAMDSTTAAVGGSPAVNEQTAPPAVPQDVLAQLKSQLPLPGNEGE
jgi:hypothetical protein